MNRLRFVPHGPFFPLTVAKAESRSERFRLVPLEPGGEIREETLSKQEDEEEVMKEEVFSRPPGHHGLIP